MAIESTRNNQKIPIPQNTYLPPQGGGAHDVLEPSIVPNKLTTGLRVGAHKLYNDVFHYAPDGMRGSVNSTFYQFLSLGMIPYIIGSAMLMLLSNAANGLFPTQNRYDASVVGKKMAAGVLLYGVGKWLGGKVLKKMINASTGVNLDTKVKRPIVGLREGKDGVEKVSMEYQDLYGSVDFYGKDVMYKYGEAQGDRYLLFDKIAKKMGYKEKLNASDQVVDEKIRETIVRGKAAQYLAPYLWAAVGVGMAWQEDMGHFTPTKGKNIVQGAKNFVVEGASALKNSFKDLYTGGRAVGGTNIPRSIAGKALIFGAIGATVLGWLNVAMNFDAGKAKGKSAIDFKKDYEGV